MTIATQIQLDDGRTIDIYSEAYSRTEFDPAEPCSEDVTLSRPEQIRADEAIYEKLCEIVDDKADRLADAWRERMEDRP